MNLPPGLKLLTYGTPFPEYQECIMMHFRQKDSDSSQARRGLLPALVEVRKGMKIGGVEPLSNHYMQEPEIAFDRMIDRPLSHLDRVGHLGKEILGLRLIVHRSLWGPAPKQIALSEFQGSGEGLACKTKFSFGSSSTSSATPLPSLRMCVQ